MRWCSSCGCGGNPSYGSRTRTHTLDTTLMSQNGLMGGEVSGGIRVLIGFCVERIGVERIGKAINIMLVGLGYRIGEAIPMIYTGYVQIGK